MFLAQRVAVIFAPLRNLGQAIAALVQNTGFNSPSGWDQIPSWTNGVVGQGEITVTTDGAGRGASQIVPTMTPGRYHKAKVTVTGANEGLVLVGASTDPATEVDLAMTSLSAGTYEQDFIPRSTSRGVGLSSQTPTQAVKYDRVLVELVTSNNYGYNYGQGYGDA